MVEKLAMFCGLHGQMEEPIYGSLSSWIYLTVIKSLLSISPSLANQMKSSQIKLTKIFNCIVGEQALTYKQAQQ